MPIEVTSITLPPVPTAVVKGQTTWAQWPEVWGPMLGKVWDFLRSDAAPAGLLDHGRNVMYYLDQTPTVEVGVEVTGTFAPAGDVVPSSLPGGLVATAHHAGPMAEIGATYAAVKEWCAANGHQLAGPLWEVYSHADPATGSFTVDVFLALVH